MQFLHSFVLTGSVGVLTLMVRKRQVFLEPQKVDLLKKTVGEKSDICPSTFFMNS